MIEIVEQGEEEEEQQQELGNDYQQSTSSLSRSLYPPYPNLHETNEDSFYQEEEEEKERDENEEEEERENERPSRSSHSPIAMSHADRLHQLVGTTSGDNNGNGRGGNPVHIQEDRQEEGRSGRVEEKEEEESWKHYDLRGEYRYFEEEELEAAEEQELKQISVAFFQQKERQKKRKRQTQEMEKERANPQSVLLQPWESKNGDDISSVEEEDDDDDEEEKEEEEEEEETIRGKRRGGEKDTFLARIQPRNLLVKKKSKRLVKDQNPYQLLLFGEDRITQEEVNYKEGEGMSKQDFYWALQDKKWCFFCIHGRTIDETKRSPYFKALLHIMIKCYGVVDEQFLCQRIQYYFRKYFQPILPIRKIDPRTGTPKPPHYLWQSTIAAHFRHHDSQNVVLDQKESYRYIKVVERTLRRSLFYQTMRKGGREVRIVSNSKDIRLWLDVMKQRSKQGEDLKRLANTE